MYWKGETTHFIYGYMVKGHRDCERGNLLLPLHGLLFTISSKASFLCTIPQTPEHIPLPLLHPYWIEREIALWVHQGGCVGGGLEQDVGP